MEWVSFGNETGHPAEGKPGHILEKNLLCLCMEKSLERDGGSSGVDQKIAMGIVQGESMDEPGSRKNGEKQGW